jgi:bifunctional DNA-binding transcriptional regulator/antitoxin component of YhaV-PrlF toxin-antitoxin module
MTQIFVQSFSQGQITIPKKFRDELNLDNVFWLKLFIDDQKRIIAEPVEKTVDKSNYLDSLLAIKGDWFDINDYDKMKKDLVKRLAKNDENTY